MVAIERLAVRIDAAFAARHLMAELFGRHLAVVFVAEVARVAVEIAAAMRERLDVIDHCRGPRTPCLMAVLAKAVRPLQPPQPLRLAGAAAETFDHPIRPDRCRNRSVR